MKNILVTGGRGFIGFNALQEWKKIRPDLHFVNLDADTYADKFMQEDKDKWLRDNNIQTYVCDLGKSGAFDVLKKVVSEHDIDTIVHFAAESHVDNSIKNPNAFFEANVLGTANILNIAKDMDLRVHLVSTDEVIGSKDRHDYCREDAPYNPSSPYSSSKASAELIALSYFKTFGVRLTISRCTNNVGRWQHSEKLIPTVISRALKDEKIPVYGRGLQRRFWIDVREHNKAVMRILESGKCGEIYNIAPNPSNLIANIDMVRMILDILGRDESLIEFVADRPAHDDCYYLNSTKIAGMLGYVDNSSLRETLMDTISWYKESL